MAIFPIMSHVIILDPEGLNLMTKTASACGLDSSLGVLVSSLQRVIFPMSQPMARMGEVGCHSMQVGVMFLESS